MKAARPELHARDKSYVTLELKPEDDTELSENSFRLLSAYSVNTFALDKQLTFVGLAVKYVPPEIVIEMTSDIMASKVRRDFRVSIAPEDGLKIRVRCGAKIFSPRPIDLSFSGVLFEAQQGIDLEIDASVSVEFFMGKEQSKLDGEVRRRSGQKYGVFFPDAVASSGQDALSLRRIVKTLELQKLKATREGNI
jgi:hypothetical protein